MALPFFNFSPLKSDCCLSLRNIARGLMKAEFRIQITPIKLF